MQRLIEQIQGLYPKLTFTAGEQFCWSPETQEIFYKDGHANEHATWSLLHETGHALLGHTTYAADYELVRLEVAAWERAKDLRDNLGISIQEDHIQDCLDTYRDWLYKRSICPTCSTKCIQQGDFVHYRCFNCHTSWRVTSNRFCRAYRATKQIPQVATTFHLTSTLQ